MRACPSGSLRFAPLPATLAKLTTVQYTSYSQIGPSMNFFTDHQVRDHSPQSMCRRRVENTSNVNVHGSARGIGVEKYGVDFGF